ncbi:MAG: ABC transporter substrate-binding protein [Holosporales bacterium]|jgi:ABC-type transporter MlaC component|nr:ABC transporter substrate-binding protein [Holosporales bacterium]
MNVFSKVVFIALLLCVDFFSVSLAKKQTPVEEVKAMFEEIKSTKAEESIIKRADNSKISRALCGNDNEEVAVAVCKHFAKMLNAESVQSVLSAPDCKIEVTNTVEKNNKSDVHVVIKSTSSNGQEKSISVVVTMSKSQKIRDIKIEGLSILQALYTQINAYVKAKNNKTLKQIEDKKRPEIIIEAIASLQKSSQEPAETKQSKKNKS